MNGRIIIIDPPAGKVGWPKVLHEPIITNVCPLIQGVALQSLDVVAALDVATAVGLWLSRAARDNGRHRLAGGL